MKITISKNKLEKKDFRNLEFTTVDCNEDFIERFIREGRVFSYNQKQLSFTHKGHSYKDSFKSTQIVIVDIDETDMDHKTITEFVYSLQNRPYLVHTTFSSETEAKNFKFCYHLIYVLDEEFKGSVEQFDLLYSQLTREYSDLVDKRADDCGRFFYGSNEKNTNFFIHTTETITTLDDFDLSHTEKKREKVQLSFSRQNNITKTDLDEDFLYDFENLRRVEFIEKYFSRVNRETKCEYDEFGFADLKGKYFYKVYDKVFWSNKKRNIRRIETGKRHNQLITDAFTYLAANPDYSLEDLIVSLAYEVQYFYNNEDGDFNNYSIYQIAEYCFNRRIENKVSRTDKKFKVNTLLYKKNGINAQQAVGIAITEHNRSKVNKEYDETKSVAENAKKMQLSVSTVKKYAKNTKTDKEIETERLLKEYNPSKSLRENAKDLNITLTKVRRIKRIYEENKKMDNSKKFLILGNNNAVTCKEIFPYIKDNKIWLGYSSNKTLDFSIPNEYEKWDRIENGKKIGKVPAISWFTNLQTTKRHLPLDLYKTYKGHEDEYPKYDNYLAFNVNKVADIPKDKYIEMEVPDEDIEKWKTVYGDDLEIIN